MRSLLVLKGVAIPASSDREVVTFDDLKQRIRNGRVLGMLFRFQDVRLRTQRLETLGKPLLTAVVIRCLSRGRCRFEDELGGEQSVGAAAILGLAMRFARDWRRKPSLLAGIDRDIRDLQGPAANEHYALAVDARPVYLRTDLLFGLESGGSVGHIAGVLNNFGSFTGAPIFVTTDRIPTVQENVETHVVLPDGRYRDFPELANLAFNRILEQDATEVLREIRIGFVYQRYSADNFTGIRLAAERRVPFVLEYNGSEVWINRHWGRSLKYEAIAERIELLNLRAADVVVVVSRPLRDEVIANGVEPARVLVNPNGVDIERYSPEIDGSAIRERYQLGGKIVIGFIGTFGPWHGAETLSAAFAELLSRHPEHRDTVRLLMIGDGPRQAASRAALAERGALDAAVFAGRTRQEDGPGLPRGVRCPCLAARAEP